MDALSRNRQTETDTLKSEIITMLGGNMVDVELTNSDLILVIKNALEKYRQRASNAVEESYMFMTLEEGVNDYTLPHEVIDVRDVFRKSFGFAATDSDTNMFDPFELSFFNTYIFTGQPGASIATYESYAQNLETLGRLFGENYNYVYNSATKRMKIMRRVRGKEEILIWIYNFKPDEILLQDTYARVWIRDYAIALAKILLGTAYSKYPVLAGPQGSISLSGDSMKAEGMQEKTELEMALKTYQDGSEPLGCIFD